MPPCRRITRPQPDIAGEFQDDGRTVLFIPHDIEEAIVHPGDRVIALKG